MNIFTSNSIVTKAETLTFVFGELLEDFSHDLTNTLQSLEVILRFVVLFRELFQLLAL